ncbi:MAG: helix-turn-helix domain-containing protein [Candidatus Hodarchaeales archaeon]|jgi:predicted transcriptional regulator
MSGQTASTNASTGRNSFLQGVMSVFKKANYNLSEQVVRCAGFDFFAEKHGNLVVTKACTTLDSFKRDHGVELRLVSEILSASPVLVAKKNLKDDAIYNRHGVPGLNLITLIRILYQGLLPNIISKRGGFYHQIRGEEIPDDETTLEKIAQKTGLTAKTLRYWKEGRSLPTPERLNRLARVLNKQEKEIIRPVNPFKCHKSVENITGEDEKHYFRPRGVLQRHIGDLLQDMDIQAKWLHSTPFDAICTGKVPNSTIIPLVAGTGTDSKNSQKRIKITANILKIIQKSGVWISESSDYPISSLIPVLSLSELEKIKKQVQLEDTIRNKQKKHVKKTKM